MADVDLNVTFTGICTYTPGSRPPANQTHREVRFVMPNGTKWKKSKKKPGKLIPPHFPFLIVEETIAMDKNGVFWGREPSGRMSVRPAANSSETIDYVYWRLENENIRIERLPETGVSYGDTDLVVPLHKICPQGGIHPDHIDKKTKEVGARVILTSGALGVSSTTHCKYFFELCEGGVTNAQVIADEITVRVRVPTNAKGRVTFLTYDLDDSANGKDSIVIQPIDGLTTVHFANAPEVDLPAVVSDVANHPHADENLHFELYYEVSEHAPNRVIPVPEREKHLKAYPGPLAGSDGCPPASNRP